MKTKLPQYWGIQCMHNAPVSTMTFQADFKVKQARSSCHSHVGQLKAAGHKAQQSGCSNTSRHVLQTCQIWPSLVISTSTSGADDVLSSRHSTHPSRHSQPLLPHMACMHWLPQGPAAQSICPCKPCHAPPLHRQLDCVCGDGWWLDRTSATHTHTHSPTPTHPLQPASQPAHTPLNHFRHGRACTCGTHARARSAPARPAAACHACTSPTPGSFPGNLNPPWPKPHPRPRSALRASVRAKSQVAIKQLSNSISIALWISQLSLHTPTPLLPSLPPSSHHLSCKAQQMVSATRRTSAESS